MRKYDHKTVKYASLKAILLLPALVIAFVIMTISDLIKKY